ncbi:hypothetical protein [Croceicoccus marinus]|uniref:Uncharacterized protein n=1 Tax=Croceicoccus marinus TaxID=450378 RepID=A0A1Z1FE75_9SPHN|nr:hypothetical protein [Croceicoccus marinus]ARU17036.1 hypothetical protein A9D14_13775 [Croceicoccus marinus]
MNPDAIGPAGGQHSATGREGRPRSIVLIGTGGSSGRTLAALEAGLRQALGDTRFHFIDTQPFNLRTGGRTAYPGSGERTDTAMEDAGTRRLSSSLTINLLLNGGPLMMRRLENYAARMLGRRHDAMIMVHDRFYIEQAFVRAAARLGTPSVLLQEGPFVHIGADTPQSGALRIKHALAPLLTRSGLVPAIVPYGFAGHQLLVVPSPAYRQRFVAAGMAPARIKVGGVPRYDPLADLRGADLRGADLRAEAQPRPSSGPLRLLYLFQPFGEHGKVDPQVARSTQLAMIEGLNRAAHGRDLALTIRIHPRSTPESVAHLTAALDMPHDVDPCTDPIEQAIAAHDLVIGHYSSGLLEAMILSRPVLCIPIPAPAFAERSEAEKQEWMARSGALLARDGPEIADTVQAFDRQAPALVPLSVLEDEIGTIDGQATARCAQAVAAMIAEREAGHHGA